MNEELQKQLIKQLKVLNFWIRFFGSLVLITLLIMGFLVFKLVWFVKQTNDKFTSLQQQTAEKLDIKSQVCSGTNSFSEFIQKSTNACD